MVNVELLKQAIKDSGCKKNTIAEKVNLSRSTLWRKLNNQRTFRTEEVIKLCELLELVYEDVLVKEER